MYSGKTIDINRLFEPNFVQVDHILPYSKSMNDSYNNKVLVLTSENQNKQDRTPFEFLGNDTQKWNDFVARVNLLKNRDKKRFLLKQNFDLNVQKEFIDRNLNDTRYMSKFLLDLLKDYLLMKPSKKKNVIRSVNGAITSYLRKFWGVNKVREDGDIHHAIDATVIATVSEGQIQKITQFNKIKEKFIKTKEGKFVDKKTGELMTKEQMQEYQQQDIDIMSKYLPTPYRDFIKELQIRSKINYTKQDFTEQEKLELAGMGYDNLELQSIKPVFVSRMKTVKHTGAIHKETMMSSREYNTTKLLVKTVDIQSLSIENKPEEVQLKNDKYPNVCIKDYYRPQDDRLLYLKLKEYLVENDNKIPQNIEFYKPKKDGSNGPLVRTVKVYEKSNSCVVTKNGAAANDTMHRVDVYKKDGKYYLCPVYMADVYAKKLPNKLIEIGKDWIDIDDSYEFMFSLYKYDLIKVTHKKEIVLTKHIKNDKSNKPEKIKNKEFLLYYNSTDISGANIKCFSNDSCYKINSLGVKTLLSIEKYYVDVMGNIYKAPKESRKDL